jgi:multiple sugar transport system permease protein
VTSVRTAQSRIEPARPGPASRQGPGHRRRKHSENLPGYAFLSPWLVGLLAITAIPMLLSLYLSFTDYDVLTPLSEANWVGWANYERMFTADPSYWHAVQVTLTFALVAVPLKLAAALGVALLLNRAMRGIGLFRGLF